MNKNELAELKGDLKKWIQTLKEIRFPEIKEVELKVRLEYALRQVEEIEEN